MFTPDLIVVAAIGVSAAMAVAQTQLNDWWDDTFGDDGDDDGDGGDLITEDA